VENAGPDGAQHVVGLLDHLPVGMVCLDRQGRVMYLNQSAERLLQ
jgi:PAS domain-containing protein